MVEIVMQLFQSGFDPAQYQQIQQPQGGGMGGMLGSMLGGKDWQSQLGNIDMENIMPGLGMDMQTGKMNTDYDLSNPDALTQGYQSTQGGFGARTNPGLSLTRQRPNPYSLGNRSSPQQGSMLSMSPSGFAEPYRDTYMEDNYSQAQLDEMRDWGMEHGRMY